jgi:hypothetical protein
VVRVVRGVSKERKVFNFKVKQSKTSLFELLYPEYENMTFLLKAGNYSPVYTA